MEADFLKRKSAFLFGRRENSQPLWEGEEGSGEELEWGLELEMEQEREREQEQEQE